MDLYFSWFIFIFQSLLFDLVRVESPLALVINGKKASGDLQAGIELSTFAKSDWGPDSKMWYNNYLNQSHYRIKRDPGEIAKHNLAYVSCFLK